MKSFLKKSIGIILFISLICCFSISIMRADDNAWQEYASKMHVKLQTKQDTTILKGFIPGTKVGKLKEYVPEGYSITINNATNVVLDNELVSTGFTITLTDSSSNSKTATIVVLGDVNKDGKISSLDYVKIKNHIMEEKIISELAMKEAADIHIDGNITSLDYVKVKNIIMNNHQTYDLSFDTLTDEKFEDIQVGYGNIYTLPTPKREGYKFVGWLVEETATTITEMEGDSFNISYDASKLHLMAVYQPEKGEDLPEQAILKASADKITFTISKKGIPGHVYCIYALNASEYYQTETQTGQFKNIVSSGEIVGTYIGQSTVEITFDRYNDGYDYIYKKYIVASNDEVANGPLWVTEITDKAPINEYEYAASALIDFKPLNTKKGVCDLTSKDQVDFYGSAWEPINMEIAGLVAPNEIVDLNSGNIKEIRGYNYYHSKSVTAGEGETTATKAEKPYIEFESNGKYYYFNREILDIIDSAVVMTYHNNVYSVGILTMKSFTDQNIVPYYMAYPGVADFLQATSGQKAKGGKGTFQGINTANNTGADYWIGLMEFFSWRYSKLGLVDIVLGNEVDFAGGWNVTANYKKTTVSVSQYSEELYRTVRLASLAMNKYTDDMDMSLSFTHYWNQVGTDEGPYAYKPKDIINYCLHKSNAEGNFNWGITYHNYSNALAANNIFGSDLNSGRVTGNMETTPMITMTNIELLELFLEQDYARVNGALRNVYITETGINVAKDNSINRQKQQAVGIAYHYFKVSMLDAVRCWPYYRLVDNPAEGAQFGLYKDNANKRLSSDLLADLDRLSIEEFNAKYIDYIKIIENFDESDDFATILQKMADKLGIKYDWNAAWKKYYNYNVRGNKFINEPTDITVAYTGKDIVVDQIKAYKGTVTIKYYDSSKKEISSIVDVGEYYYKAFATDKYAEPLESDYKSITVTQAENGCIYEVVDGVVYFSDSEGEISLPEEVTYFGKPAYVLTDYLGNPVSKIVSGVYNLHINAVEETANYKGLESQDIEIRVTKEIVVTTYQELLDALNKHYIEQLPSTVITLANDIDAEFKPFAVDTKGNGFSAKFNGNGKTIKNILLNDTSNTHFGLFGILNDRAIVKDLTIDNFKVSLNYTNQDDKYTKPLYVGPLAAEVKGTMVEIENITINNPIIEITNRTAKDHALYLGGAFGSDGYTKDDSLEKYVRKNITVNNPLISIVENAEEFGIGGYAGQLHGYKPDGDKSTSKAILNSIKINGGKVSIYDPASDVQAGAGGFVGQIDNYIDITLDGGCTSNIALERYDSRLAENSTGALLDTVMPGPGLTVNWPAWLPSSYYLELPTGRKLLGWFGIQTNITTRYWNAPEKSNTVDDKTYTIATFNIDEKAECTTVMRQPAFIEQNITLTKEQLKEGYKLTENSVYIADVLSDITWFDANHTREFASPLNWDSKLNAFQAGKYDLIYAPTYNLEFAAEANAIGYWYNPSWVGTGDGSWGWCMPYHAQGACYINPDELGFTTKVVDESYFDSLDKITLYGFVTAKDGSSTIYQTVKLNITCADANNNNHGILFLGDSIVSSAQYFGDTKAVLDNYNINPEEIVNRTDAIFTTGGWSNSGGWSYLYALDHKDMIVYNYGYAGATINDFSYQNIPKEYNDFKRNHSDAILDRIVIEASYNDVLATIGGTYNYGADVMKMTDFTKPVASNLKTSTLGAFLTLVQTIQADYPNAEIVVVLPPERFDLMYQNPRIEYINTHMKDIASICDSLNIAVVDLWNKSGLHCSNDNGKSWNVAYYSAKEGVHPGYVAYKEYLYPTISAYLDECDMSVLVNPISIDGQNENKFTSDIKDLTYTYTGKNILVQPEVSAQYGEVYYKYYDKNGEEVASIKNAGIYTYKAFVRATKEYKGLASEAKTITVNKLDDSLIYTVQEGVITVDFVTGGVLMPEKIAKYATPAYTITDVNKKDVTKDYLERGEYTIEISSDPGDNNHTGIAAGTYKLFIKGDPDINEFTQLSDPVETVYTGNAIPLDIKAVSKYGEVSINYYDHNKNEINVTDIVDAGTYYFKATVDKTYTYTALDSDYVSITVKQATNAIVLEDVEGVVNWTFSDGGAKPEQYVLFGNPTITYTKVGETNPLGKDDLFEINTTYTLVIGAVEATSNYTGIPETTLTLVCAGQRVDNSWTVEPLKEIKTSYTGNKFTVEPIAKALSQTTVVYSYFDKDGNEVDVIEPGTYTYKATVAQTNKYKKLEFEGTIIVGKTANELSIDTLLPYTRENYTLTNVTKLTAGVSFKIYNSKSVEVTTMVMGQYTLVFDDATLARYTGLDKSNTIQVGVIDYDSLYLAISNHYLSAVNVPEIYMYKDVDCSDEIWDLCHDNKSFSGLFDGNGHSIDNLTMTNETLGDSHRVGFLSNLVEGAEVKNLIINDATVELISEVDNDNYTKASRVGILAANVSGSKVKVSNITINNAKISVINKTSKDHQYDIGGVFGFDWFATKDQIDNGDYLRKNITVNNLQIDVIENAKALLIGGIAGTQQGLDYTKNDSTLSALYYENCDVNGGYIRVYDAATIEGTNSAGAPQTKISTKRAMGAYIGRLNKYTDITLKDCSNDIELTLYDANAAAVLGSIVDLDMNFTNDPGSVLYAAYLPSSYNYQLNEKINLLGWFGVQWKFEGRYWEAYSSQNGANYLDTFNLIDSTCTSKVQTMPYMEKTIEVTREQLQNGVSLDTNFTYMDSVLSDITFYRQSNTTVTNCYSVWDVNKGAWADLSVCNPTFGPTCGFPQFTYENYIGYLYADDNTQWCLPYGVGGAIYFDPYDPQFNFATKTVYASDFANDAKEAYFWGFITEKNASDASWAGIIQLTVKIID